LKNIWVPSLSRGSKTATAPVGNSIVGTYIMGRALATVVPNKYAIDNYGLVANAHSSCNCLKGNCSIKEKIIFGSGVKWCEGN